MMDMMVADLDKETLNAEMEEKDGQDDYEKLMADVSNKRSEESKAIVDKTQAKADMETELMAHTDNKEALGTELQATQEYIAGLHKECDWLLENFDQRKAA